VAAVRGDCGLGCWRPPESGIHFLYIEKDGDEGEVEKKEQERREREREKRKA
jgi:hypothetical protein